MVNVVSKRPLFNWRQASLSLRADSNHGRRAVLDVNTGSDRFALRVAALGAASRTIRENLGTDDYGLYAALGFRVGSTTVVRVFHELTDSWGNVAFTPASADLNNFLYTREAGGQLVRDASGRPVVNADDPRRGQDVRYLALTGKLDDLRGVVWDGPMDFEHISSFGAWWSSEHIHNNYNGVMVETRLPWGFAAQLTAIYSVTTDERATVSKSLVPPTRQLGSGANPIRETAKP